MNTSKRIAFPDLLCLQNVKQLNDKTFENMVAIWSYDLSIVCAIRYSIRMVHVKQKWLQTAATLSKWTHSLNIIDGEYVVINVCLDYEINSYIIK